MSELTGRLLRVLRKPPAYILERAYNELRMKAEKYHGPRRSRRLTAQYLANGNGHPTIASWWDSLSRREYPATLRVSKEDYFKTCPGDFSRIIEAAEKACAHRVSLLGSGEIALGADIDWQRDYKTGYRWPHGYFSDLQYGKPDQRSDVKFPWEVSRLQWLIPAGQAYLLTGEERYAAEVRSVIESWIADNPYAGSINWAVTMEVAIRVVTLSWLFHVFKFSAAWRDEAFRERLLRTIYLHGDFTARHLEKSDINGNHYTADAAGLVYAGLFFGGVGAPAEWLELGWKILCDEIPKQVYGDGADFEGSIAYHRLVQELFLLPALYRRLHRLAVSDSYRESLIAMARFTAAYSRKDGSVPLVGDADDARTLPFGDQGINDHRYLLGVCGSAFNVQELIRRFSGSRVEVFWLLGADAAAQLNESDSPESIGKSSAFRQAGYYVLRNRVDHVFVNCGPLGLGGRGGHSHNDSLSFEAVLRGVHLVSDCGAYVYTSDYAERNRFRSTGFHNTPKIDNGEINRFVSPTFLWSLHNDARPDVREVEFTSESDRLTVSHTGYHRLESPVTPIRTITLFHDTHRLAIRDEFDGAGNHTVEIPLHLAPGVEVREVAEDQLLLATQDGGFRVTWQSLHRWDVRVDAARISPSYGIVRPSKAIRWRRDGNLSHLHVEISPA